MAKITIDREKCKGCLLCIRFCPKGSLGIDNRLNRLGFKPVKFKKGKMCMGCCICAVVCPDCCIEVYK
ncbi:MAG: 4Fe-4S binding protein [Candidatus Omnitrophota bacterium]